MGKSGCSNSNLLLCHPLAAPAQPPGQHLRQSTIEGRRAGKIVQSSANANAEWMIKDDAPTYL